MSTIPALFFATTVIATAIVLARTGTGVNHFLDLQVAALIVFAAWLFGDATREGNFGLALLAFVTLFALSPLVWSLRHEGSFGNLDVGYSRGFRDALQFLGKQDKPILSGNPMVPILAGQRPYLLDGLLFTLIATKNPSFAQPMSDAIRQRRFAATVLGDES